MAASARGTSDPVTMVVTRVVRPGKEDEFVSWADDIDTAVARFPGHLAAVRLHAGEGLNHLIYQFDSPEHLHAWEVSAYLAIRERLAVFRFLLVVAARFFAAA